MKRITKLAIAVAALALSLSSILTSSFAHSSAQAAPALYGSKCSLCHGKDGTGAASWKTKGIPDFTDAEWQSKRTDQQIGNTIKNGKGKYMPSFKEKLSDEEISSLVATVRRFKR